jgi:hypothetical protein
MSDKKNGDTERCSSPAATTPSRPNPVEKESITSFITIPKIPPKPNQRQSTFKEQLQDIDSKLERDTCKEIPKVLHGNITNDNSSSRESGLPVNELANVVGGLSYVKPKKVGPIWKRARPKSTDTLQDVPIFSAVGYKRPNPEDCLLEQITAPELKKIRGDTDTDVLIITAVAGVQPRRTQ